MPPITICIPTTHEREPRLNELLASISQNSKECDYRVLFYPNSLGGWVPAVHRMLLGVNGYVVLLGSDVIVEKDWLSTLWKAFISAFPKGDGAAEPYNELHGETLCQHPLAHSETIKRYLHKGYIHNFSDNEMTERLLAEGKLIFVPDAKIEHKHLINGKAKEDQTYRTVFSSYERDRELFIKRKADGFKT